MENNKGFSNTPPQAQPIPPAPSKGIPVVPNNPGGGVSKASVIGATSNPGNMEQPPPSGAPVAVPPPPPSGAPVQAGKTSVAAGGSPAPAGNQAPPPPPPPSGQPVMYDRQTDLKDGINKCPYCGSSDIQLNMETGQLQCNYCHREFSEQADTIDGDISKLSGIHMGMGAADIQSGTSDMVTLKCTACGAEVVIDTTEAPQARCHWCRNMLSLNQQVPNGAVPDAVLPFKMPKAEAQKRIEEFVGKRQFFAHPKFKAEFTTQNIMGVYLPYMVVDINASAQYRGEGEHEVRRYTVGSGDDKETRYDADLYAVGRDFDLYINDLTVEASGERLNQQTNVNSNNIINAILPYPVEQAVRFNANYLRGFTSEKRTINREQVGALVAAQARDISRFQAKGTTAFYGRGVRWDVENLNVKGELWKTVYLPVWLYSYLEVKSNGQKFLHYVAVNAYTGETMGSVPIHKPKLFAVSAIIEAVGLVVGLGLTVLMLFS